MSDPIFGGVMGQDEALARLEGAVSTPVHAYMFLGPNGSGRLLAAQGFAGLLLAVGSKGEAAERHQRLALGGIHPDLVVIEAQGAALRVSEAEEIIRHGTISPVEGKRKVIIVKAVDEIEQAAIGKLLKIIEEPPQSVVFVLLAEENPPEIITISSRCLIVDFVAIPRHLMETVLFAEGVEPAKAKAAAAASGGDMARARLLANDAALSNRADLWKSVPGRLDGTGATVADLTNEIRAAMDAAQEPLDAKQSSELSELAERVELTGERGSGRSDLVARHKREVRRLRNDEVRFGLATLARHYRDRLTEAADPAAEAALQAVRVADDAVRRNPNEALLLQNLFGALGH